MLCTAEAEAAQLQDNVKALLDNDQPAEAIRLLEDGVERAGHDPFVQLRLRHFLAAALYYAGEYTRAAPLFDVVARDYRRYLPPSDAFVLDSPYHAGHAYAEISEPDKALPQLRFYLHHAGAAGDEEADKVLGARFALAQMLAAADAPTTHWPNSNRSARSWLLPSALTRLRSATSTSTSTG